MVVDQSKEGQWRWKAFYHSDYKIKFLKKYIYYFYDFREITKSNQEHPNPKIYF